VSKFTFRPTPLFSDSGSVQIEQKYGVQLLRTGRNLYRQARQARVIVFMRLLQTRVIVLSFANTAGLIFQETRMATSQPAPGLSLIPTFLARLDQLKAVASGLRELPQPRLDELKSLLERAQKLVEESTALPGTSESEPALKPSKSPDS
jgi:hypothetical protein